jgi:sigma-B regulation protein RsbU (phosphoserine phosphatase)
MLTLDYAAECRSARRVGGDYYDFLTLGPDKLGIALGDISGKGISAALLMASLQALLRSRALLRPESVADLVADINRHLAESTDMSKYATFVYGVYDDARRTLCYVNAGHCPPLLFRPCGQGSDGPAAGEGFDVSRLECGGPVIGLLPDVTYDQEVVELRAGDILVIYSDGISEAADARDDEFGEERLIELVRASHALSAGALRDLILQRVEDFAAGVPQRDDQTLIVAKVR